MCQRFCYCFDMLAFHICRVYFNFLNIYRQIGWPTTGNLSTVLIRAGFRCQLLCRLLIRRLQRVLRLSHFSLTQHRISESILSVDNETNGTSGIKCNFVCNWKSTCSFWWSLSFFSTGLYWGDPKRFPEQHSLKDHTLLTETFPHPSSGFKPSYYLHPLTWDRATDSFGH